MMRFHKFNLIALLLCLTSCTDSVDIDETKGEKVSTTESSRLGIDGKWKSVVDGYTLEINLTEKPDSVSGIMKTLDGKGNIEQMLPISEGRKGDGKINFFVSESGEKDGKETSFELTLEGGVLLGFLIDDGKRKVVAFERSESTSTPNNSKPEQSADKAPLKNDGSKPKPASIITTNPPSVTKPTQAVPKTQKTKARNFNYADIETAFKKSAGERMNAVMVKDWEKAVPYLFPEKIEFLGGFDAAVKKRESSSKWDHTSWTLNDFKILNNENGVYVGVANVTTFGGSKEEKGIVYKTKAEYGIVGYSKNQGDSWNFANNSNKEWYLGDDLEASVIEKLFPGFFDKNEMPESNLYVREGGKWVWHR